MPKLNIPKTRDLLQQFEFKRLFIDELGWGQSASRRPAAVEAADESFLRVQIAELSGVVVFEVTASDGRIPDAKTRAAIHKETAKLYHENLLIFIGGKRTQSLWYWVKREGGKSYPREHSYFKAQPGDLFLSKLGSMVVEISEFDERSHRSNRARQTTSRTRRYDRSSLRTHRRRLHAHSFNLPAGRANGEGRSP